MKRWPIYLKGFLAFAALMVFGYLAGTLTQRTPDKTPVSVSYGEAQIGGAFDLVTTRGEVFTDQDLLGKYALIYFGYTNCPDVCPLDMNKISMTLEALQKDGVSLEGLQPVFISVDHKRDSPASVAGFLDNYHPAFIGLSGNLDQIEKVAKAYKVYYEEILTRSHDGMTKGDEKAPATLNHSSFIYLMGPDGKYLDHFDSSYNVSALKAALREFLE